MELGRGNAGQVLHVDVRDARWEAGTVSRDARRFTDPHIRIACKYESYYTEE